MEKSAIRSATEQLSQLLLIKPEPEDQRINNDGEDAATTAINIVIPVQPFISLCNSLIHVLDKIGPTMAVLRQEIRQNIERLEMAEEWGDLVEILKKEGREGRARTESSCSRAFLWLIRSLDFTLALLEKITSNEAGMNMERAVEESYNRTLKAWHGWISSAAYKIALKLVPDTPTFINIIMEDHQNYHTLLHDIHTLIPLLSTFLEQAHSILRLYNLNRIKSK
ncbi:glycolipid transfer protein 3-like isoform X1 [Cucurbita maxima]|uniref:Glycolipid transfer protein 3-like isoform X1 n=1 Tax=Cucurbita maxima TaxID=3661 RepID=A0A6J1IN28_CUCMA|nr:glycolipid transfer protein 3-like isoform X1 [Cucurbita maxima]